jgi:hypothetical protein
MIGARMEAKYIHLLQRLRYNDIAMTMEDASVTRTWVLVPGLSSTLAMRSSPDDFASLCLSFLVCKMVFIRILGST